MPNASAATRTLLPKTSFTAHRCLVAIFALRSLKNASAAPTIGDANARSKVSSFIAKAGKDLELVFKHPPGGHTYLSAFMDAGFKTNADFTICYAFFGSGVFCMVMRSRRVPSASITPFTGDAGLGPPGFLSN